MMVHRFCLSFRADNREVFYWVPPPDGPTDAVNSPPPPPQCAPAGAELRPPRDPRPQISSLHALPFSRRRALTGPTSHLVVKGLLNSDTTSVLIMPRLIEFTVHAIAHFTQVLMGECSRSITRSDSGISSRVSTV